jgi:hypothetical protein
MNELIDLCPFNPTPHYVMKCSRGIQSGLSRYKNTVTVHKFNGSWFTGSVGIDLGLFADIPRISSAKTTLNGEL